MDLLSHALRRIGASPTVAITAEAQRLRAEGRDIIALSSGEPDFDTPAHIRAAAVAAIERGETRYTAPQGRAELRAAIVRKLARENGVRADPDGVIVSTGGKQVIFNALLATLDPGDEVVIPSPYWVSYPDIVRFAGGTPVIVPTSAQEGWRLDPASLADALTPATKWVLLNSPCNPTGAGYGAQALRALAEVIRPYPHIHVLSDEIYEHIAYPPFAFASFAAAAPDLSVRTLTVNGVSKGYAMTGWRIGYGAGPADLIRAMTVLQSQSTTSASTISQCAAEAALDGPTDTIQAMVAAFAHRRDLVLDHLGRIPGLSCTVPEGAFYVYPSVEDLIGRSTPDGMRIDSDSDLALALLREAGVAVVPGAAFGASPNLRLSFAAHEDVLAEACARIARFCATLRA